MDKKYLIIGSVFVLVVVILIILFLTPSLSEEYIRNRIDKANYCNTKDDCERVNSKCPFGCHIFVNKNEVDGINRLINLYPRTCLYRCRVLKDFDCIDNKCQAIYE